MVRKISITISFDLKFETVQYYPVPSAYPRTLNISDVGTDSVELTWQPPALPHQNGVIIGYVINITSLDSGVIQQLTSSSTTLRIMNLQPFTVYSCVIAARTAVGLGPFSTIVSVRTMEAGEFCIKVMNFIIITSYFQHLVLIHPI